MPFQDSGRRLENMPGRNRKNKREIPQGNRSTAAIFRNVAAENREIEKDEETEIKEKQEQDKEKNSVGDDEDDPDSYGFPFNYIFKLQDFLNYNLTFCKVIQILIHAFLLEVYYLGRENFDLKMEEMTVLFNVAAVSCGTILSYVSRLSKSKQNPSVFEKPTLPEFSYIHALLIPLYLGSLHKSSFFVVNLSLNYYLIEGLNTALQFCLSFIFYQFYSDNSTTNASLLLFILSSATYIFLKFVIEHINEEREALDEANEQVGSVDEKSTELKSVQFKTLGKAEIHFLTVVLVNLFLNISKLDEFTLPLFIFQKLILSLCISLLIAYPICTGLKNSLNMTVSILILTLSSGAFYLLVDYQLKPVLAGQNPVTWILHYIYETPHRFNLFKIWTVILTVTIPLAFFTAESFSLDVRRKMWHVMLMALIAPSLQSETQFTLISLLGIAFVFLCVEILRFNKFTFLGVWLNQSLRKFQDFKDLKGPLNLSYLYLIVGCTMPIIIDYCIQQRVTVTSYMGLVALGLGDSLASLTGRRFGSLKWKGSKKSVQGTLAFVISTFLALSFIDYYILIVRVENWENLFIAVLLSGVLEGVVDDLNDNFVIPMFMVASYEILNKTYVL